MRPERVDHRRVRVGHEQHVGFLDLLESADGGTVETETVDETVFGQLVCRHGEVLHQARQVTKTEVDDVHSLVLHEANDLSSGAFLHLSSFFESMTGSGPPGP